jgi:hypothetical protein
MLSRCGGMKATRIFGNQRILTFPESLARNPHTRPDRLEDALLERSNR